MSAEEMIPLCFGRTGRRGTCKLELEEKKADACFCGLVQSNGNAEIYSNAGFPGFTLLSENVFFER